MIVKLRIVKRSSSWEPTPWFPRCFVVNIYRNNSWQICVNKWVSTMLKKILHNSQSQEGSREETVVQLKRQKKTNLQVIQRKLEYIPKCRRSCSTWRSKLGNNELACACSRRGLQVFEDFVILTWSSGFCCADHRIYFWEECFVMRRWRGFFFWAFDLIRCLSGKQVSAIKKNKSQWNNKKS